MLGLDSCTPPLLRRYLSQPEAPANEFFMVCKWLACLFPHDDLWQSVVRVSKDTALLGDS